MEAAGGERGGGGGARVGGAVEREMVGEVMARDAVPGEGCWVREGDVYVGAIPDVRLR